MDAAAVEFGSYRRELLQLLRSALSSQEYDVMVLLFGLEDGVMRSLGETAEALGVGLTTVKIRRRRALSKLQSETIRGLLQDCVPRSRTLGVIHSTTNE